MILVPVFIFIRNCADTKKESVQGEGHKTPKKVNWEKMKQKGNEVSVAFRVQEESLMLCTRPFLSFLKF